MRNSELAFSTSEWGPHTQTCIPGALNQLAGSSPEAKQVSRVPRAWSALSGGSVADKALIWRSIKRARIPRGVELLSRPPGLFPLFSEVAGGPAASHRCGAKDNMRLSFFSRLPALCEVRKKAQEVPTGQRIRLSPALRSVKQSWAVKWPAGGPWLGSAPQKTSADVFID